MKTLITKTAMIAALALIITGGSGCKKEEMRLNAQNSSEETSPLANRPTTPIGISPGIHLLTGKMIVYLRDIGNAGFGSINLTFAGIALHYKDERIGTKGWVTIQTKPRTLNLLEYQIGSGALLAASKILPSGDVDEARVLFGNPNYVLWGNTDVKYKADLFLDKDFARLSIPVRARVNEEKAMVMTLDFNANQSIDREVVDHYVLKPSIVQHDPRIDFGLGDAIGN